MNEISLLNAIIFQFNTYAGDDGVCIEVVMELAHPKGKVLKMKFGQVDRYAFFWTADYAFYRLDSYKLFRTADSYYVSFDPNEEFLGVSVNDQDYIEAQTLEISVSDDEKNYTVIDHSKLVIDWVKK